MASTPEQLYVRNGTAVASEAVAGTRARGPAGRLARPVTSAPELIQVLGWIQTQLKWLHMAPLHVCG